MSDEHRLSTEPTPAQVLYARILEIGMYVGLACLFVTFALYASGLMGPYIPKDDLSQYWTQSVHEYLEETGIETGWSWVTMLGYGDFLNFVGIAILAGATIVCYLSIVPLLIRSKDYVYALLALLEVAILTVAASGIIEVGH
jgi:hypothetical protein